MYIKKTINEYALIANVLFSQIWAHKTRLTPPLFVEVRRVNGNALVCYGYRFCLSL